jgi:hypothetical protein
VLALAVGAAAATGAYALLDSETVVVGEPEVIVAEVPAPGTVAETKNEAAIAAAITSSPSAPVAETKNEAATAAAITSSPSAPVAETKNEAATAAAITSSPSAPVAETKNEAATAAAVAPRPESAR